MITPDLAKTTSSTVALTRCDDYKTENIEKAIQRQFYLLDGNKAISRGDKVLLKPNFIIPRPPDHAVQTDPAVILAVARFVKDLGAKPFVADSPAWNNVGACVKALGLGAPLEKMEVPVMQLNKPKRIKIAGTGIGISTVALEADKIINLPKFKTHQQLGATFAIKNIFGCVCGKEKAFWHFAKGGSYDDFCQMLIGIFQLLSPVLTIIDGVVAMQGKGPINGKPKSLGFLIGGSDPVACEALCCELVRFKPDEMPIMRAAKKIGFGCADFEKINILGDDYRSLICNDFQPSEQIPLRFSFPQICKSVIKQLIFLTKSFIKNSK